MPRVTVSINAPNEALDQDLLTLDLPPGLTVRDLKGFVEAETSFPADTQNFFLNGRRLGQEDKTLEEVGIKDGEMLAVLIRQRGNGAQGLNRGASETQTSHPAPDATQETRRRGVPDPEQLRLHVLNDPAAQSQLQQQRPELFAAINDPARWREAYQMYQRQEEEAEQDRLNQIRLLNEDPFNIDAQRKIEDIIRQDRVIENLQHAYEHNPEVFARVHMLYINTEVNGHAVKAFVDSGAQATIMSPSCAEKCGIMRLIDTRFAGIARGVGTAQILGRVHHAEIKIGGAVLPCAFTVMEGKDVDLLFGLDMLKRYKAKIDLEKNALCFEGIEVPFLPEHEIPKSLEAAEVNEPTLPGPNNTEIGAQTGAVRPAGSSTAPPQSSSGGPSSSQQPPLPPRSQAAPAPSPAQTASFPEESIEQLTNLGFSRQQAIQALQATGGHVEYAAGLLLENSM